MKGIRMAKRKTATRTPKRTAERPVLVTTAHRGVFFGYLDGDDGKTTVKLKQARNCIYWSSDVKGFLGLAATGPSASCRIGPAADITLFDVTSVSEVTPKAEQRWREAPWSR
jgi:hypothetical protein